MIVVFDLTRKVSGDKRAQESFEHVHDWIKEVEKHAQPDEVVKLVIGNKSDVPGKRAVSPDEIQVLLAAPSPRNL